ncbi:non-ribosomal peptide synthetase [Fictibacillus fluitans]|uniref:Amino acid adenylation domain-containing protein n=1 Tax=Fictibacillus fluitans TaxID=3058422 RepID=A0ABT8HUZ7_9BACL|nr:non-ribosomal peptide synthetase [Fictibacillus sp. NE201]MDN4524087.1 amino acid adenylation domain-containing protein [Fictibacillus sp. NE201]
MGTNTVSLFNKYEVSHTQKRFWFIDQLDYSKDESIRSMSHVSTVFTLSGTLDLAVFQKSIQDLTDRHQALRTCLKEENGTPFQLVYHRLNMQVNVEETDEDHPEEQLEQQIQNELNTPFNLEKPPLLRVRLYRVSKEKHVCLVMAHHIIADGLSIDILLAELMALYRANLYPGSTPHPASEVQYSDYAHWHNSLLNSPDGEMIRQKEFWSKALGELPDLNFPVDRQRSTVPSYEGSTVPLVIESELLSKLKKVCEQLDVTLYMFLLGVKNVLLAKYTRNKEIIVGTSFSGRFHPSLNQVIGSFINTLPIRNDVNGEESFTSFVKHIKQNVLNVQENQAYPFDKIVEDLGVERNSSRNPIFDVVFEMHTLHSDSKTVQEIAPGLLLSFEHSLNPIRYSPFDFAFELFQKEGKIEGYIQYATSLFNQETMERLGGHFLHIVQQVVDQPSVRIEEIDMLSAEERDQILLEFNQLSQDFPTDTAFPLLFEKQVQRTPNHIAVTFEGTSFTYQELNEKVNQTANYLISSGVVSGKVAAVMCERSVYWLTSLLAILKSGAVYVPIDPNLPDERAAFVLNDCGAECLFTQESLLDRVAGMETASALKVICPDAHLASLNGTSSYDLVTGDQLMEAPTANPEVDPRSDRLAYMIYTSGSTGNPKGALVRHNGMINHLYAKIFSLQLTEDDVVGQNASISFDVSIWQSLVALLVGGKTSIISFETGRDQSLLIEHLIKEKVTIIETVPSLLFAFLDTAKGMKPEERFLNSLRWMIANGEELPVKLVTSWFDMFPEVALINAYGPTECSDDVTQHVMRKETQNESVLARTRIPIGKPLPNMRLYVVDQFNQLAPVGVKGEILIAGIGVGSGYWNNEILTQKKFIENPFARNTDESTVYRTGDLGCWLPDGSLEFSSRIDFQVKVRGFRIELGEVEAAVNRHRLVDEAAVVVKKQKNGDSMLIAFYTSKEKLEVNELREYLQTKLPYYMVPAQITGISSMPLLTSEKIDRKMLLQWADQQLASSSLSSRGLQTETEQGVARLWEEILEQKHIRSEDNFFHIGGHSISAVKLVNRIREQYSITMPLQQIFITPVLKGLSAAIDQEVENHSAGGQQSKVDHNSLRRFPEKEVYELAPVQLPEWYLHQLEPENPFYNVSFDLMFYGEMNLMAFEQSWQALINRHSALRLRFINEEGSPKQVVSQTLEFTISSIYKDRKHVLTDEMDQDIRQLAYTHNNQIFDFENGPLFSVQLAEYRDNQFFMMFAAHHIIWDETSSMNLVSEFSELYNTYCKNEAVTLPDLEVEYTDYAEWMNNNIKSGVLEEQKHYWLEKFKNVPPALELPTDFPRPPVVTFNGGTVLNKIDVELQKQISEYCQKNHITLYMFLLSVLNLQLHRLSGQQHFAVGSPIVNRDDIKLERMLGLFATAIPLACQIDEGMTFTQLANQSKQNAIEAYDNHLFPSNLVIEELQTVKDLSRSKLFSVMYGLQNNKQNLLKSLHFEGLSFNPRMYDFIETSSRFDLSFAFDELEDRIEINVNYNSDLFKHSTAERLTEQFIQLAKQVTVNPDQFLHQYEIVSEKEKQQMKLWNKTEQDFPDQLCVQQLIEQQAALTPEEPAVIEGGKTFTYKELNERANQLAHLLIDEGIQPEERIGITLDHSAELIISLLGVMKAGGAYVPISPELPLSRKLQITKEASITRIITDCWYGPSLKEFKGSIMELTKEELLEGYPAENVLTGLSPSNLAYVLFTSGTTGKPKGIEVEHRGVVSLLTWLAEAYPLTAGDSILFMTSYSFDASLLEIFWPLTRGARVVIPQMKEAKDIEAIGNLAHQHNISFLQFVPIMLDEFINARKRNVIPDLPHLRYVICGGAPLTRKIRDGFMEQFKCSLNNHYGPTEVTVDATVFDCSLDFEGEIVPIGKPISNSKTYVLDSFGNQVPIGVPGELCVQSFGVARGYLNDPAKNAECFREGSFDKDERRLYKTGDIVKLTEEGNIQYIGRLDNQAKVRGNRVELEEVEAVLMQNPEIGQAAVLHRKDEGHDELIAYVELDGSLQPFSARQLKMFTYQQMPNLQESMNALHRQAWPEYFLGDRVMVENWPKLYKRFPDYQFSIIREDGEIAAVGNTVPVQWDGSVEQLPNGWDEGLLQGLHEAGEHNSPDTLLVLAGVVNEKYQGHGLASILIEAFKHMAHGQSLKRIIVPVRPTGKTQYPDLDFPEYCSLLREDGLPVDPWLRSHIRAGGKVLQLAEKSQVVEGTIEDWKQWGLTDCTKAGSYHIQDTLQPVWMDPDNDRGVYYDPSIWVQHFLHEDMDVRWTPIHAEQLEGNIKRRLPHYMVPNQIVFLRELPTNANGKVDKKALAKPEFIPSSKRDFIPPQTDLEAEILDIWIEVLKLDEIGVTENFFDLGGHSLKATAILARINASLQCNLTLRELFEGLTIRRLAQMIEQKKTNPKSEGLSFKKVERRRR